MSGFDMNDESERPPQFTGDNELSNELSADSVNGNVVQAGVVHGDINIAVVGKPEPAVPRQLPPPPAHFTDRVHELAELDSRFAPRRDRLAPGIVVVTGPGGVGKTALALRWAAERREWFADGQLFADLVAAGASTSATSLLGRFLRAAGVPASQIPVDEAERAALWRSWTATRAVLVVLDNARVAAPIRALVPGSATSAVLVTSRNRLAVLARDGATSVQVAPLDVPAGLELLRRSIGGARVEQEPNEARRLVGLCGGLPIAVCVAAAQLSSRPVRSIQRAVRDLSGHGSRLAALSRDEELSVRAVFDSSYEELPDAAARLYRLASLHPGDVFSSYAAAALVEVPEAEALRLLDVLVDANLLQETSEDRYRFHDLVRQHAHELAEAAGEADPGALVGARICEWYLEAGRNAVLAATGSKRRNEYVPVAATPDWDLPPEVRSRDRSWEWLDLEQSNIVAAMRLALVEQRYELAWHLADVTRPLLRVRKDYRLAQEIERDGLVAAKAWGDGPAQRSMLKRLARSCSELGDVAHAEHHAREALRLAEEDDDQRGVTSARKTLALLLVDQERYEAAEGPLREIVESYRFLGRKRSRATTQITLGTVLLALQRADEAVPHLESAIELLLDLERSDEYNLARARSQLGQARAALGEHAAAHGLLEQARVVLTQLGSRFEQALVHEALADLCLARNSIPEARQHLSTAVTLLRTLESMHAGRVAHKLAALDM